VPGLGRVTEIGQIGDAFGRMLSDLRSSTERLEDLVFKLSTLNEVVELASRVPQLQDLLALVLERTMRTVRATIGSIMLLDHDRQVLRVVAARGLPDDVVGQAEVAVGEGVAGKVVQMGEPVLVEDIS
jgi:signal transduction protein with GAF and PtsI domain